MKRFGLLFARALRLRCPACGRGSAFSSWFRMRGRCAVCGLEFERGEGYFLGAQLCNLVVAELLFAGGLAAWTVATWPDPPWQQIWIGSIAGMIASPLLTYPFSKTIWLAIDLLVQPTVDRRRADRTRPS